MDYETFAERKRKQEKNDETDVYKYDEAPAQLRHQICIAFVEGIGGYFYHHDTFKTPPNANAIWNEVDRICSRELASYMEGKLPSYLDPEDAYVHRQERFLKFISEVSNIDDFLSAVEIGCLGLSRVKDGTPLQLSQRGARQTGAQSIQEINRRFERHGIGYQFEGLQIIRVDSRLVHAEVIKPALQLLTAPIFVKANEEFLTAHRHYRSDEFKDAITAANRSFECLLKAICEKEGWAYGAGDRASELVKLVRNNGLFTHNFDRSFDAFVAMLKSGLPDVRNNAGGHGVGIDGAPVTAHLARFAINLTASNVLLLAEAYELYKANK